MKRRHGLALLGSMALPVRAQVAASAAPAASGAAVAPQEPRLEFVYEARVRLGEVKTLGTYADGHERGTLQLLGGAFAGPRVRGIILPSSKDWPVWYGNGVRLTDVNYLFVTDDGAHLFVTVHGYRYDPKKMSGALREAEKVTPPPNLLRVFVHIQAPEGSPHAWMNHNLFVGVAGQAAPGPDRTALLRVYRLL